VPATSVAQSASLERVQHEPRVLNGPPICPSDLPGSSFRTANVGELNLTARQEHCAKGMGFSAVVQGRHRYRNISTSSHSNRHTAQSSRLTWLPTPDIPIT